MWKDNGLAEIWKIGGSLAVCNWLPSYRWKVQGCRLVLPRLWKSEVLSHVRLCGEFYIYEFSLCQSREILGIHRDNRSIRMSVGMEFCRSGSSHFVSKSANWAQGGGSSGDSITSSHYEKGFWSGHLIGKSQDANCISSEQGRWRVAIREYLLSHALNFDFQTRPSLRTILYRLSSKLFVILFTRSRGDSAVKRERERDIANGARHREVLMSEDMVPHYKTCGKPRMTARERIFAD